MIRAYLGVSYVPGGTTGEAIDCTGLTQRLLRGMTGVVIPRHTTDQLAFFARRGNDRPLRTGDLVFIQYDDLVWHVGFAVQRRDRAWSVIHASSLTGRVIEHGLDDYLRPAIRTQIGCVGY
jgi:cell wall-associated NlpC family hydrolase